LEKPQDKSIKNKRLFSSLKFTILFLGFNYTFMGNLLNPALPGIQSLFSLTATQLSLMASLPALISMTIQPFSGWLSDKIDRKLLISFSLISYLLSGSIIGASIFLNFGNYLTVLLGRLFSGLGELGAFPQYLALIQENFSSNERQKIVGNLEFTTSLGGVIAPIIGGSLIIISLGLPFIVSAVSALLAFLIILCVIPKNKTNISSKSDKGILLTFRSFKFHYGFIAGAVIMGTLVTISTFLGTFVIEKFNFQLRHIGYMLAIIPFSMAIGSLFAGRYGHFERKGFIELLITNSLSALALLMISFTDSIWLVIVGLFFIGFALGFWLTIIDHDVMGAGERQTLGLRMSFFQQSKAFGILVVPLLLGSIIDLTQSYFLVFILLAIMTAASGIIIISLRKRWFEKITVE